MSTEGFPRECLKSALGSKDFVEAGKDYDGSARERAERDPRGKQGIPLMGLSSPLPTRCALFLVLKGELELARNDMDLCQSDLHQVLFLLESCTGEQPGPHARGWWSG